MTAIDYEKIRGTLEESYSAAESYFLEGEPPKIVEEVLNSCETIFHSRTQAYREVLLGCILARILNREINIRHPYVSQSEYAFNGRTLDEKIINPFLHDKRIPSSRGPYLGVFRRSVKFNTTTREGLRDKEGYDAFLSIISYAESISDDFHLSQLLLYLLYKFLELRESSTIPLTRLHRISLSQYDTLISGILLTKSGGRFPVLLVISTFSAIKEFFGLDWTIEFQGINVADTASGAGGDITIKSGDQVMLSAEVTERPIDKNRVVATFNTKIGPAGIEEYLFFVHIKNVDPEAAKQAQQYFSQGHEVNFLEIKDWILMTLATIGRQGRGKFNQKMISLLEDPDIPKYMKVSWNEQIEALTEVNLE
jgi:hypothetical protein